MNPWDLSAADLIVFGLVLHCVADWMLQSDWMAANKANLRHPAGYVHAGIHGALLALVFGWLALPIAVAHLLIDTRKPVVWLSRLMRQTQPQPSVFPVVDVGLLVRFNVDQTWHVVVIALAAVLVHA